MQKRIKKWIPLIALLALLIGGVYFVCFNEAGFVGTRILLAGFLADKGENDKAHALYLAVTDRYPLRTEAWLYDARLYASEKEYEDATDRLIDGLLYNSTFNDDRDDAVLEELREELTSLYLDWVKYLVKKEEISEALRVFENANENADRSEFHDPWLEALLLRGEELLDEGKWDAVLAMPGEAGEKVIAREELASLYLRAYQGRFQELDAAGESLQIYQEYQQLESAFAADELIGEIYLRACLALAQTALAEERYSEADMYARLVLDREPENAEALAILELLAEANIPVLDSFMADGSITAELSASYMGFSIPLSLSGTVELSVSGLAEGDYEVSYNISIDYDAVVLADQIVKSNSMEGFIYPSERDAMFDCYRSLVSNAVYTGQDMTINGRDCMIYRYTITQGGIDELFMDFASIAGMDQAKAELLSSSLGAEVIRYVDKESGDVVRIEADLTGSDLAALISAYAGDMLPAGITVENGPASVSVDISGVSRK